jgi:hypothetical protein
VSRLKRRGVTHAEKCLLHGNLGNGKFYKGIKGFEISLLKMIFQPNEKLNRHRKPTRIQDLILSVSLVYPIQWYRDSTVVFSCIESRVVVAGGLGVEPSQLLGPTLPAVGPTLPKNDTENCPTPDHSKSPTPGPPLNFDNYNPDRVQTHQST